MIVLELVLVPVFRSSTCRIGGLRGWGWRSRGVGRGGVGSGGVGRGGVGSGGVGFVGEGRGGVSTPRNIQNLMCS